MVTDRLRERREQPRSCESSRTERGQVILIGAIALAFIILGVVIVFNGVVYTETLSSAQTGQSASTAETTELEIEQGVGCLLTELEEANVSEKQQVRDNISVFTDQYRNATVQSSPTVINITPNEINGNFTGEATVNNSTVTITYDSNDFSYEQNRTIEARDCSP